MTWVKIIPRSDVSWHDSAACRGADFRLFFSQDLNEIDQALEYCAVCPVVRACARDRVLTNSVGVWGGKRWVNNSGGRVVVAKVKKAVA